MPPSPTVTVCPSGNVTGTTAGPVPGAWVTATQYEHGLLGGGGTATVEIYLVVNERPGGTAWRALDSLYRKALLAGVIPTEPTRTNEAVQLQGPQPLPAFVITTTIENC